MRKENDPRQWKETSITQPSKRHIYFPPLYKIRIQSCTITTRLENHILKCINVMLFNHKSFHESLRVTTLLKRFVVTSINMSQTGQENCAVMRAVISSAI